jgi:predicted protein tyrosine phosphatase
MSGASYSRQRPVRLTYQPPPAVLFTQNKPATSNQAAVLFSHNKSAPTISHQSNEQAEHLAAQSTVRCFTVMFVLRRIFRRQKQASLSARVIDI